MRLGLMSCSESVCNRKAIIRRTIIDDYDLEGEIVPGDAHDACDAALQRCHFIVARNDYAQLVGLPPDIRLVSHNDHLSLGFPSLAQ